MLVEKNFFEPAERTYAKMLSSLIESARVLSGKLSLDELGYAVIFEVRRIFDAKAAWVLLYDSMDDRLKMHCYWGPDEEAFRDMVIRPGVGISGGVFLTQRPEVILASGKHPASMFRKKALSADIPAIATYPLTVGEKKIGVFGISSEKIATGENLEGDIDPVLAFVKQTAIAFENAMLFEEKKKSERELKSSVKSLQMLNEIGIDLDLSAIIRKVARYTAEILDADAAVINLGNEKGTAIDSVYLYNMPPETEEILLTRQTIARAVFKNPRRILINNYPSYPEAIAEFVKAGLRCIILVPVISKGSVLATLSAISFSEEREFSEDDFDKLEFVARQVAIAIENARLYCAQIETRKRMETYADQLRLLNELSQAIIREKEPQYMADQLADGARILLDCTSAAVLLYKEVGDGNPMMSWSADSSESCEITSTSLDLSVHDGLYSEMSRTKKSIRLDDVSSHPHSRGTPERHPGLRGLLGAPLLDSEGNFIGQVMVTNKKDGSEFSETDEELLVTLCAQVSIGIEKARAYEREHGIAEVLQQAILDVPRSLPGVEIGITYESAGEAAKVGGDFYDLFELGDGRIGILIGDVSGKGLEAATITSMVKSTIRAFAYKGLPPAYVLTEANRVICEQLRLDQFVTMVYGALDPKNGKLLVARAGHPEVVIWRESGCNICGTESNLPLGVITEVTYKENEVDLSVGDTLILYTDGLVEAKCDNLFLGEDRMIEELNRVVAGRDPQQVTLEMVNIAKEFTGGRLQDDAAVVALRLSLCQVNNI
ncbi:MAG: SpoIIE family protein phosphatase [Actinobacteria bacterium]|nr:SpoIIE family protein phosphatase [Actinomycetota bacterium]